MADQDRAGATLATSSANNASGGATDVGNAATTPADGALDATAPGARGGSDDLIGTSVGRYRVLARIGAGGMGVVYRAFDPALDRTVALKVLPPLRESQRTNLEERLRREAQALARLDHPNVVAVYDVGVAAASLFVAMQFVDGTTLDQYVAQHPQSPREVIALCVAAGRGLAAAHAAGIIHRDVKPANILVDRAGRVYVGDFGLARATDLAEPRPESSDDLLLAEVTRHGAIVGTPLFMAPEQHRGEPATPRSDQYGFCLAAWQLLFGRHPFTSGPWSRAETVAAMEADRLAEPPRATKVPARAIRALRRGLRHDPAARWPSMTALCAALAPRSRTGWIVGGVLGAGLISGAVAMMIVGDVVQNQDPCANAADRMASVATAERARAITDGFAATKLPYAEAAATRATTALGAYRDRWSAMRIEACRANRVRRDQSDDLFDRRVACLDQHLAALDSAYAVLATTPSPDAVDRALEIVDTLPALDVCADVPRLSAIVPQPADSKARAAIATLTADVERARVDIKAGTLRGAVDATTALVARARAIDWAPLTYRALRTAADAHTATGDTTAGIADFRAAALEASRAHDDRAATEALIKMAYFLSDVGKASDALVVVADAELGLERAGDPPDLRSQLEAARGVALGHLSRFAEADAAFVTALTRARGVADPDDIVIARTLLNRANFLHDANDVTRARAAAREAQQIFERLVGPDHPALADVHQTLGNIAFQMKEIDEGKAEFERFFAIMRARWPDDSPLIGVAHFNLGTMAIHQGRLDDAATEFDAAYQRLRRSDPDHPNTFAALYMLGVTHLQQARYDDALHEFQQVRDFRLAKLGADNVATADVLDAIGEAYGLKGDTTDAFAAKSQALAIREKALGVDNPDVGESLGNLASLALDRNDCVQAIPLAKRSLTILDRKDVAASRTIATRHVLASCAIKAGRFAEGVAGFEQALAIAEVPGSGDIDTRTTVRTSLADALYAHGQRARARKLYGEARALFAEAGRTEDVAEIQQWLDAHP
ncbi:MAG: tetratricopeptide repeat protein [Deltaproteobacteria bacterium]|nr:tetratricopeptide repeat protein [Deltaproteobacteria bacterium]